MKQHDVSASFKQQPLFKLSPVALVIASLGLAFQPVALAAPTPTNQINNALANNSQINSQINSQVNNNPLINTKSTAENTQQKYNINSGPLSQVLSEFAGQAGIALSFNAINFNNIKSSGLQGSYSVEQGFTKLLSATNYAVEKQKSGSYVLVEKSADDSTHIGTLATAIVESDNIKDGSAEDGYISDGNTSVGIWQNRTLQETPYSINVVATSLIQNLQANSIDKIFKINPVTQFWASQANNNDSPIVLMRGFKGGMSSRNGITRGNAGNYGFSMTEIERVEILTGTSGFLYGTGSVGGLVNYVTKRPTVERLNSITLGNTSGENMYLHGDFGGKIDDDGDFGYRVNLLTQDGETAVAHQKEQQDFASLALGWQVTDDLLLQVDASHRNYKMKGSTASWVLVQDNDSITGKAKRPDADDIDSGKTWSQQWGYAKNNVDRVGVNMHWQLIDNVSLRAAYLSEEISDTGGVNLRNTINIDGTYSQQGYSEENAPRADQTKAMFAFFDIDFSTGSLEHTVTTGIRHRIAKSIFFDNYQSDRVVTVTNASLSEPVYINEPEWSEHGQGGPYVNSKSWATSYSIGDDIRFNEQWSALIGINKTRLLNKYYKNTGEIWADWTEDNDAITPTLSLIYQATDNLSSYVSYMEALEPGGYVGDDMYLGREVINYDATLDPAISKQLELGFKLDLGGMLLTTALFEIDKILEYYVLINNDEQAEFIQDGRQIHRGLEFTATGQLTDNLTLVGGFTLLDAKVDENKQNPELQGNRPGDVADKMFKLYGEYKLSSVPELVLNAGFSHTGSFYSNIDNTEKLDAYTLFDIGARYQLELASTPVTLRLNISNLTDESYWAGNWYLGEGRRMTLSANFSF